MEIVKTLMPISLLIVCMLTLSNSAAQTSVTDDEILIVPNIKDQSLWLLDKPLSAPKYPADLLRAGVSGCVSIGFLIGTDGSILGHRILLSKIGDSSFSQLSKKRKKDYAASLFIKAAMESLKEIHFIPGPENPSGKPAFSYQYFSFWGDGQRRLDCEIPDLKAFLMAPKTELQTEHESSK